MCQTCAVSLHQCPPSLPLLADVVKVLAMMNTTLRGCSYNNRCRKLCNECWLKNLVRQAERVQPVAPSCMAYMCMLLVNTPWWRSYCKVFHFGD